MRGQGTVVAAGIVLSLRALLGIGGRTRVPRGLTRGNVLLEVLKTQLQLAGAQLLRSPPKLLAQQTLDEQTQFLDLGVTFVDRALQVRLLCRGGGHHLAQHLLQRCGVVRQGIEIDWHDIIMIDPFEPQPMTLP
jgi:hypothetical protein